MVPKAFDSGRVAALEIMIVTPAIQNLIREGKTHQIESVVQTGLKYGMKTMDMALAELCRKGIISNECALTYSINKDILERMITL